MGFYLLGKGHDEGDLRLITSEFYSSRQEALAALSKLSADPAFPHRDADVFVADLDSATPVLLVAPTAPVPDAGEEASTEDAAAEDAGAWEAPELEGAVEDSDGVEQGAETPEEVEEPIASAVIAEAEDVADEPHELDTFAEVAEAVAQADEGADLADALKRAADTLESEGIVAPESVGPEVVAVEPKAPEAWPWDDSARPAAKADKVREPEVEPEPEADVEPEPEADAEAEAEVEPEPEPEAEVEPEAEAAPPAEPEVFVPNPFEEPAVDGDTLLPTHEDDEVAFPQPVIMGAYAETDQQPEDSPVVTAEETPAEEIPIEETPIEETVEAEPPAGEPAAEESPDSVVDSELESVLADLEVVEEPTTASPDAAVGQTSADMRTLTCGDCVYVKTCPNKEGLEPSSCGNFQWRST